ncbi:MAG TPA: putative glycolipid-binding domain-containing protein [Vicinamibacterales bacterium]|nr:putative glycolipid-binding domain-containing protein [Vicinamibacterales bacterium]
MDRTIVARWQDWSGDGLQHLVLRMQSKVIVAEGVVLASQGGRAFGALYRIESDLDWRVRMICVRLIGADTGIELASDGAGRWRDGDRVARPDLDAAIDVDLSATPFTNTLPIRRLDLKEGQSADIRAVYVQLPELTVTIDPQRYTCLQRGRRYRYESLDSDFVKDIEIDSDGLVVAYPELFKRVL